MKADIAGKPRRPGFWRMARYMILMGVLIWWLAFPVMPVAIGWEIAPSTVDRIPVLGFLIGAALGLCMGFFDRPRTIPCCAAQDAMTQLSDHDAARNWAASQIV